ncbi:MAG: hypothetical protein HY000_29685 [Planctomycetes bacterium]|nr:hypothetical protein [Planctomycetota bacterium]
MAYCLANSLVIAQELHYQCREFATDGRELHSQAQEFGSQAQELCIHGRELAQDDRELGQDRREVATEAWGFDTQGRGFVPQTRELGGDGRELATEAWVPHPQERELHSDSRVDLREVGTGLCTKRTGGLKPPVHESRHNSAPSYRGTEPGPHPEGERWSH